MMNFNNEVRTTIRRNAHWLLRFATFILSLSLLAACDPYQDEKSRRAKYQATVNPENGRIVEVNGEEFRIVYIGGVRFRFPEHVGSGHINWTETAGGPATGPTNDGVGMVLLWPDIPPGKAPNTKFVALEGDVGSTNSITVQVRGTSEPIIIDKTKEPGWNLRVNSFEYIVRDDLELGLKTFVSKTTPKELIDKGLVDYAYSLTDDAKEPWGGRPIVVSGNYINFMYAPQVSVGINMMGWTGRINPNWKGIYLGVVETLNKYREDKVFADCLGWDAQNNLSQK